MVGLSQQAIIKLILQYIGGSKIRGSSTTTIDGKQAMIKNSSLADLASKIGQYGNTIEEVRNAIFRNPKAAAIAKARENLVNTLQRLQMFEEVEEEKLEIIETAVEKLDQQLVRFLLHTNILAGITVIDQVYEESIEYLDAVGAFSNAAQQAADLANAAISSARAARDKALEYATNASNSANSAQFFSTQSANSAADADGFRASAEAASGVATNAANDANTSARAAAVSVEQAESFANNSFQSAQASQASATVASIQANDAIQAASAAVTASEAAAVSANSSQQNASAARESQLQANTSAGNARVSELAAAGSQSTANSAAAAALVSQELAANSALDANTFAAAAANSATVAASEANSSAQSATAARQDALAANTAYSDAVVQRNEAVQAANNAQGAAASATTQAGLAANSAFNANTFATASSNSATQAATSANSAGASAGVASNAAIQASVSANNAQTSASAANSSAVQANSSAAAANSSQVLAAQFAGQANTSANNANAAAGRANTSATIANNAAVAANSSAASANNSAVLSAQYRGDAQDFANNAANSASQANSFASIANSAAASANASAASAKTSSELSVSLVNKNRQNYIDLSGWRAGQPVPWNTNGGQQNIFYTLPDNAGWNHVNGPRGTSDDVWLARADGSGQAAGGWNNAPIQELNPDQQYRFMVPIMHMDEEIRETYWGTTNVCDINTQTLNGNPYFAYCNQAIMVAFKWYLFVGYLFPRNSTGKTHTGAGIYDMETGELVKTGFNFCFHPDGRQPTHRAYQFYATNAVYQSFGRPSVELVDGTEPPILEAFKIQRQANARITSEESVRASADSALANRASTLESQFAGNTGSALLTRITNEESTRASADSALANRASTLESTVFNGPNQNSTLGSRITNEESTRASQDAALANRASTLESQFAGNTGSALLTRITNEENTRASADSALSTRATSLEAFSLNGGVSLNANPHFTLWDNPLAYPKGWDLWEAGSFVRSAETLGRGGYCAEITSNNPNAGWKTATNPYLAQGWYVIEAEVWITTGSYVGSGISLSGELGLSVNFATEPDTNGVVGSASNIGGGVRRFSKLVKWTGNNYLPLYAMNNWTGFGTATAKTLRWLRCSVRSATDGEIKAQKVIDANVIARITNEESTRASETSALASRASTLETNVANNSSRISTTESTTATLQGAAATYQTVVSASGSNNAVVQLKAGLNGSNVALAADRILLMNGGTAVPALTIENGNATFSGELNVGTGSGQRVNITKDLIRVFDANGTMRVRMGVW